MARGKGRTCEDTVAFPKNNDNGQKLVFSTNNVKIEHCPVQAALRIRAHAQGNNTPLQPPMAIFPKSRRRSNPNHK